MTEVMLSLLSFRPFRLLIKSVLVFCTCLWLDVEGCTSLCTFWYELLIPQWFSRDTAEPPEHPITLCVCVCVLTTTVLSYETQRPVCLPLISLLYPTHTHSQQRSLFVTYILPACNVGTAHRTNDELRTSSHIIKTFKKNLKWNIMKSSPLRRSVMCQSCVFTSWCRLFTSLTGHCVRHFEGFLF